MSPDGAAEATSSPIRALFENDSGLVREVIFGTRINFHSARHAERACSWSDLTEM
jgi:hypothetical protein